MKFLNNKIETKQDIKTYIDNLNDHNMLYHFEDDARDIVDFANLSENTLDLLDARTNEVFEIDSEYAFDYMCELLNL